MDNVPLTDLFIVTDVLIFEIMRDCLVGASTWLLIVCQSMYVYIICIMQVQSLCRTYLAFKVSSI